MRNGYLYVATMDLHRTLEQNNNKYSDMSRDRWSWPTFCCIAHVIALGSQTPYHYSPCMCSICMLAGGISEIRSVAHTRTGVMVSIS